MGTRLRGMHIEAFERLRFGRSQQRMGSRSRCAVCASWPAACRSLTVGDYVIQSPFHM